MKEYLTTQPSGLAISTALFVIVVCFPLALLSGMNVDQAVLANVVLLVIVVPLAWRAAKRYQALPTADSRAADAERAQASFLRNRKLLYAFSAVCGVAVVVRLLLH